MEVRKCDWCEKNSTCSGGARQKCILSDYVGFQMEKCSDADGNDEGHDHINRGESYD